MMIDHSTRHIEFDKAREYVLNKLSVELPTHLQYHSVWHTEQEVVEKSLSLALQQNLSSSQIMLVHTAALYHDIGFIVAREEHEFISAKIAAEILPKFGYSNGHIDAIQNMIMATRIPQKPQNLLEAIIADADLDLLGRTDFLDRNDTLRKELANEGVYYSDIDWYQNQLSFLKNHQYFTASARRLRSAQKHENYRLIDQLCRCAADTAANVIDYKHKSRSIQRIPL
jgi:uncharacterized protein